ncbi:hypothetical protein JMA_36940 [Jeotgalibacillus malaysiensis]|uniref:Uncharacterized protein n=1 Tax=Jeotgalibacillus malaysiensis TaxID=1508404 RepID=A0A0B5ASC4_9BACL|nr:hypothetical protein JMA_36940 [Jeotgalibacillus malaysiensis]
MAADFFMGMNFYINWQVISASGGRFPWPGGEPAGFAMLCLTCPFLPQESPPSASIPCCAGSLMVKFKF